MIWKFPSGMDDVEMHIRSEKSSALYDENYDHAFYAVNAITDNNCGRDNDSEFFGLRMQIRFYGIGKDGI